MENRYSFSDHVSDPPPAARTIHMASRSATYAGVPAIIIFDRTLNIGRIITP